MSEGEESKGMNPIQRTKTNGRGAGKAGGDGETRKGREGGGKEMREDRKADQMNEEAARRINEKGERFILFPPPIIVFPLRSTFGRTEKQEMRKQMTQLF